MTGIPGRFGAVVTAMVSPFAADGALDVDGAVSLARWMVANGSDALVLAGSTGEGSVLDDGEKRALWEAVASAVTVPTLAATGAAGTAHSVDLGRIAEECKVDGLLVVTPYYVRPSQAGLAEHFAAVAAATRLPVLLYDIPVRSGRKIAIDTTLSLVERCSNIVGVKDAAGDLAATARLAASAPSGFEVYCGDDALTLPMLAVGSVGLISVASHWAGPEIAEMITSFAKGDVAAAAEANARLLPSWDFESGDAHPNPIPAKAMMRVLGLPSGQCRLPLGGAPEGLEARALSVLEGLGKTAREGLGKTAREGLGTTAQERLGKTAP